MKQLPPDIMKLGLPISMEILLGVAMDNVEPSQKITISLDYKIDENTQTVVFSHPNLVGSLAFSFSTIGLARIQLDALNENRPKSELEMILSDTAELKRNAAELIAMSRNLFGSK